MRSVPTEAEPETRAGTLPSERDFWVTKWLTAVLAGILIISVHGGPRAQDAQSAIDDAKQFAEYLDTASSHMAEKAKKGEIRSDPLLAVIMNDPVEFREAPPYGPLNLLIGPVVGQPAAGYRCRYPGGEDRAHFRGRRSVVLHPDPVLAEGGRAHAARGRVDQRRRHRVRRPDGGQSVRREVGALVNLNLPALTWGSIVVVCFMIGYGLYLRNTAGREWDALFLQALRTKRTPTPPAPGPPSTAVSP